jgi:hypothetical protein
MSDLNPGPNFCERCRVKIKPDREVWLELDQRTNTYTDSRDVPPEKSQGWFVFGADCAEVERARHEEAANGPWIVSYKGFLQPVTRRFVSKERAEQWARLVGVFKIAVIKEVE